MTEPQTVPAFADDAVEYAADMLAALDDDDWGIGVCDDSARAMRWLLDWVACALTTVRPDLFADQGIKEVLWKESQ